MKFIVKFILIALLALSIIIPNPLENEPLHQYEFNVTYVNNTSQKFILLLPKNIIYSIEGDKGTYYLCISSKSRTIWGYTALATRNEGTIYGVIYVNSVKRLN